MAAWVSLLDLKADLGVEDERDDDVLRDMLDAAAVFVERMRPEFDYGALAADFDLDNRPPADVRLGTVRLAGRWHTRRRSPDGLVQMAELGASRVPSFDPDIERLLGIGRYRGPVIA